MMPRAFAQMLFAVGAWLLVSNTVATAQPKVKLGNDIVVAKHLDLLKGKRVGLVVNHTARLSSGEFLVDVLMEKGINVVALFGPEHGVRGDAAAGDRVDDGKDEKSGIPVFSLYGRTNKPTLEMLANVDVLVYDIQDVGVRFYTYISTMGLCMESAAERGIPFVVLDRPNPLGGLKVEGPIVEDSLRSFVGKYPIPVVYGLTCGELAKMINGKRWLAEGKRAKLTVIPMAGWRRSMTWRETGLAWIPPSPNIKTVEAAFAYPMTCFFEATNISEGRGTEKPFQFIGAPFAVDERMGAERVIDVLTAAMNSLRLPGVHCSPIAFTPTSSKFKDEASSGVAVEVTSWDSLSPVISGLRMIGVFQKLYPQTEIRKVGLQRLLGSSKAADMLVRGDAVDVLESQWRTSALSFRRKSEKYFIYGSR